MRTKTKNIDIDFHGKIPPQARELEAAVLGAILIEKEAISYVCDILKPDCFYVNAHATIYQTVQNLFSKSQPIDLLTTTEHLRKLEKLESVGGAYFLSELTNLVASSANIEYHARIIKQKYIQREMIRISNLISSKCYEDIEDVFEVLDNFSTELLKLNSFDLSSLKSATQIENKIRKNILENKPIAKVYNIGICGLDFMTKTFNVIAGLPATGKTAFMLTSALNLSKQNISVAILSLEMAEEMLVSRLIQTGTAIASKKIITNNLSEFEKNKIFDCDALPSNIYIDDNTDITDVNIISKIKGMALKYKIQVLFLDYLQLVGLTTKGTEVKAMELLTNSLQKVAKDLDICIIGLSQINKENEKPTMKSLRGGGIEQAASDIYILHDEYYKQNDGKKWQEIALNNRGRIELIYAKGRYSAVENRLLYFDKPKQLIFDWNIKPIEFAEFNSDDENKSRKIF